MERIGNRPSNMKKVLQMTSKHDPDAYWDAESRIAGMVGLRGFISAAAVASKRGSDVVDLIISYHELSSPDASLVPGQRYAWIMVPETKG